MKVLQSLVANTNMSTWKLTGHLTQCIKILLLFHSKNIFIEFALWSWGIWHNFYRKIKLDNFVFKNGNFILRLYTVNIKHKLSINFRIALEMRLETVIFFYYVK